MNRADVRLQLFLIPHIYPRRFLLDNSHIKYLNKCLERSSFLCLYEESCHWECCTGNALSRIGRYSERRGEDARVLASVLHFARDQSRAIDGFQQERSSLWDVHPSFSRGNAKGLASLETPRYISELCNRFLTCSQKGERGRKYNSKVA